jgi:hypothetical protein
MRKLFIGLCIFTCLWALPSGAQPAAKSAKKAVDSQLGFTGFAKESETVDEPVEFASAEARTLWEHVVRFSRGTSETFGPLLLQGGSYVGLGEGCFLVLYAAIQHACLGTTAVEELTPWSPPGNTEILAVRRLGGETWWALVRTSDLSHGVVSESYHALIGSPRAGANTVTSKLLASSASADAVNESVCEEGDSGPLVRVASKILSYVIQSESAASDKVLFRIIQVNCRTGRKHRLTSLYRLADSEVRRLR